MKSSKNTERDIRGFSFSFFGEGRGGWLKEESGFDSQREQGMEEGRGRRAVILLMEV